MSGGAADIKGAGRRLLAVIPHGGLILPAEIAPESLSDEWPVLVRNIDWFTGDLYDFRDILGNAQAVFPYCSLLLEANRHPRNIDAAAPLCDVWGRPVYRPGKEPTVESRKAMAEKYLDPFHQAVGDAVAAGANFILEGHATVTARGMSENQIDLMNMQTEQGGGQVRRFCPDEAIQAYAEELGKRLPDIRITVNASDYLDVYGHISAEHSIDAAGRVGRRAPAILQETNLALYLRPDGRPDIGKLNRLRRAFAESLGVILSAFSRQ
ncbi:MAG: N-formylglutamate amidohydrolase [Candidatus Aminicenantes bacterium]|nr:N-formylglutamate amidohydrolase [Candidatus Aminicenantes bacterium]